MNYHNLFIKVSIQSDLNLCQNKFQFKIKIRKISKQREGQPPPDGNLLPLFPRGRSRRDGMRKLELPIR